ncbi:hypothetical protein OVA24_13635 [Luteolibacter sp. SL250]|uniref:hypothetical protein n=1 Tax=Luteolibacter sp. SL250 TaxID=2995170 RepID=UPI00226F4343|nr:hypothetical protein [Luteolibacter sp. SL250]WAC18277.1 hypothetical protein OVA24_13635 [Luteolibacter sp. SL250]
MKPKKTEHQDSAPPAPTSPANVAPKQRRTAQDVRRDNVRSDIGNDDPKILGR